MAPQELYSQGCVAIRGGGLCGRNTGSTINLRKGELNAIAGLRHFTSYKHFVEDVEQKFRVEQGTEVINITTFLDLSLSYGFTDRLFGTVVVPVGFNDRSSMYEHGGNPKFDSTGAPIGWPGDRQHTYSSGIGDVRLSLGYWLFDPDESDFNYSVGLGVKLPTGKYDYNGLFYNQGTLKDQTIVAVVDQSIQPGDGGTGATLELQGIHPMGESFTLVSSFFYLANFTEINNVLTRTGTTKMAPDTSQFSSPDQYGVRIGTYYTLSSSLSAYMGARLEGIPSSDLIGGSAGFRRPGYVASIEPGLSYANESVAIVLSVPVALYRNRTQSYIDKIRSEQRGTKVVGDAAFADYLVNLTFSFRFGGEAAAHTM